MEVSVGVEMQTRIIMSDNRDVIIAYRWLHNCTVTGNEGFAKKKYKQRHSFGSNVMVEPIYIWISVSPILYSPPINIQDEKFLHFLSDKRF